MPVTKRHQLHHIIEHYHDSAHPQKHNEKEDKKHKFQNLKCHHYHLNFLKHLADGKLVEVHREMHTCDPQEKAYLTQRSAEIAQRLLSSYRDELTQ